MTESIAKVFISCGQKTEKERAIAKKVAKILKDFDTYIAVEEQSLSGFVENIFYNQLKKSEYFLFIDFKREKIIDPNRPDKVLGHRGSLFSHQELAVATFLRFGNRFMGFIEEGIVRDGISGFTQFNCDTFRNEKELLNKIRVKFEKDKKGNFKCGWKPNWKNQLNIEGSKEKIIWSGENQGHRYYYLKVINQNIFDNGKNCHVFLEKICNPKGEDLHIMPPFELKWRGLGAPDATIFPGSYREAVAFYIVPKLNGGYEVRFQSFLDSNQEFSLYAYLDNVFEVSEDEKDFILIYQVICDNFAPGQKSFRLKLSDFIDSIEFNLLSGTQKPASPEGQV